MVLASGLGKTIREVRLARSMDSYKRTRKESGDHVPRGMCP